MQAVEPGRSSRGLGEEVATRRIDALLVAAEASALWCARRRTSTTNRSTPTPLRCSMTGMAGSCRSAAAMAAASRIRPAAVPGWATGRVRRARDLDRPVRAGALGHVVLELLRDVAVLLAEDEPRRQLLPQRPRAGRLDERLLGDRPLRDGHPRGRSAGTSAQNCAWKRSCTIRSVGAVAARHGLQRVAERAARRTPPTARSSCRRPVGANAATYTSPTISPASGSTSVITAPP